MSNDKRARLEEAHKEWRKGKYWMCDGCPDYRYCSIIDSDRWAEIYDACLKTERHRDYEEEATMKKEVTIDGKKYVEEKEEGEVLWVERVLVEYDSIELSRISLSFCKPLTYFQPGDTVRISIVERGKG